VHFQHKAWMDSELFLVWIEEVLKPYCKNFTRTLLIMDMFGGHKKKKIMDRLAALHVDVCFIPSGLTYKLQPLDVYLNKPLKDKLKDLYEEFISSDNLQLTAKSK